MDGHAVRTRSRNNALIFACLLFFGALRAISPEAPSTLPDWDWRAVVEGPTADLGLAAENEFTPVRVVGDPADIEVRTTAELLWSAGLLGVRIGPPSSTASSVGEVWVLSGAAESTDCSRRMASAWGAAVLGHVAQGGAVIAFGPCEELSLALGAPPRIHYAGSPGQTAFIRARDGDGPVSLPLASVGFEFGPAGIGTWNPVVSRAGGRPVVFAAPNSALFSFSLSTWLRLLRQGDPAFSGQDRDGIHGPKPNDLRPFPWAAPLWSHPTVTVWTEVLVSEVSRLALSHSGALPRLWALPSPAPSALILTSDQDFAEPSWMDSILARVEERGGEMTLLTTAGTRQLNSAPVSAGGGAFLAQDALTRAKSWGHGIGMHPNPAGLATAMEQRQAIRTSFERTTELLGESPRVVRNHYLAWWDAEDPMSLYAELDLWMELNFVSIGGAFAGPGFLFGSARPARFITQESTLPVLSQATQIEDDVLTGDFSYSAQLSSAEAVAESSRLFDVAVRHGVPLVANLHPLWVVEDQGELLGGLLDAAEARGLPIVSSERWATQSWQRLRMVMTVAVTPGSEEGVRLTSDKRSGPAAAVPQWLWTPGGTECVMVRRPSVLSEVGCLKLWPIP